MRRLCILGIGIVAALGAWLPATAGTEFKWSGLAPGTNAWESAKNWSPSKVTPGQVDGDDWVTIKEPIDMPVLFQDSTAANLFKSRKLAGVFLDGAADIELNLVESAELHTGQFIMRSAGGRTVLDVDGGMLATETLTLDGTGAQDVQLEISSVVTVSTRTIIKGTVNIAVDEGATFDAGEIVIKGGAAGTTVIRIENPSGTFGFGVMHSS